MTSLSKRRPLNKRAMYRQNRKQRYVAGGKYGVGDVVLGGDDSNELVYIGHYKAERNKRRKENNNTINVGFLKAFCIKNKVTSVYTKSKMIKAIVEWKKNHNHSDSNDTSHLETEEEETEEEEAELEEAELEEAELEEAELEEAELEEMHSNNVTQSSNIGLKDHISTINQWVVTMIDVDRVIDESFKNWELVPDHKDKEKEIKKERLMSYMEVAVHLRCVMGKLLNQK